MKNFIKLLAILIILASSVLLPQLPQTGQTGEAEAATEPVDISGWTEADPNSRIDFTDYRARFTLLERDEDAWLYDNYGVDYFTGDFTQYSTCQLDAITSTGYAAVWMLANEDGDDVTGLRVADTTTSSRLADVNGEAIDCVKSSGNWVTDGIGYEYLTIGDYNATIDSWGGGMRFLNLAIPDNAVITSAILTVTASSTQSGANCDTEFYAQVTEAAAFTNLADAYPDGYQARRGTVVGGANNNYITSSYGEADLIAMTSGTAYTLGTGATAGTHQNVDLITVIQEVVDDNSGIDDLVLWADDHDSDSTSGSRRQWYVDVATEASRPLLTIKYATATSYLGVYLYNSSIYLEEYAGSAVNDSYAIPDRYRYRPLFLKIQRDEYVSPADKGFIKCFIYSDVARTVLLDTLQVTLRRPEDFSTLYLLNTLNDSTSTTAITGFSGELYLETPPATFTVVNNAILWTPEDEDDMSTYLENIVTGTHTGANNQAVLTDSGGDFINDGVRVGDFVYNTTDASYAKITARDATTITGTLVGGTDNDWDTDDAYKVIRWFEVQPSGTTNEQATPDGKTGDWAHLLAKSDGTVDTYSSFYPTTGTHLSCMVGAKVLYPDNAHNNDTPWTTTKKSMFLQATSFSPAVSVKVYIYRSGSDYYWRLGAKVGESAWSYSTQAVYEMALGNEYDVILVNQGTGITGDVNWAILYVRSDDDANYSNWTIVDILKINDGGETPCEDFNWDTIFLGWTSDDTVGDRYVTDFGFLPQYMFGAQTSRGGTNDGTIAVITSQVVYHGGGYDCGAQTGATQIYTSTDNGATWILADADLEESISYGYIRYYDGNSTWLFTTSLYTSTTSAIYYGDIGSWNLLTDVATKYMFSSRYIEDDKLFVGALLTWDGVGGTLDPLAFGKVLLESPYTFEYAWLFQEGDISDYFFSECYFWRRPSDSRLMAMVRADGSVPVYKNFFILECQDEAYVTGEGVNKGSGNADDYVQYSLYDSGATFQTDGVVAGWSIWNTTLNTRGVVDTVVSETELHIHNWDTGANYDMFPDEGGGTQNDAYVLSCWGKPTFFPPNEDEFEYRGGDINCFLFGDKLWMQGYDSRGIYALKWSSKAFAAKADAETGAIISEQHWDVNGGNTVLSLVNTGDGCNEVGNGGVDAANIAGNHYLDFGTNLGVAMYMRLDVVEGLAPPEVWTLEATQVRAISAILWGNGTLGVIYTGFAWGLTEESCPDTLPGDWDYSYSWANELTEGETFSYKAEELLPETLYFYIAWGNSTYGDVACGATGNFTTLALSMRRDIILVH